EQPRGQVLQANRVRQEGARHGGGELAAVRERGGPRHRLHELNETMSLESIRLWLRALVARTAVARDLDRARRVHPEMAIEKHRRSGLSLEEATRRTRLEFGGVERYKEAVRDERGVRPLEDFAMDVRYAMRGLMKTPAFTIAALIVLGLGIGAATSVAAIVDHVLRRPLPFPEADRLVFL